MDPRRVAALCTTITAALVGVATVPLADGGAPSVAPREDRAKWLHFNNDLVNTESQRSPFHPNSSAPFTAQTVVGAVNETAGLGITTHLLSPGFGWVAWWPSKVAPPRAYDAWFRRVFGAPSADLGASARVFGFIVHGGDVVAEFVKAATTNGQRPAVTFRINDFQSCAVSPAKNYGTLSRFWFEHRDSPGAVQSPKGFNATCCWEHRCPCVCNDGTASMVLSDPDVLANRRGLMLELISLYPTIDFELDFERWPRVFNTDETPLATRQTIVAGLLRDLRLALSPTARLGLRVPPDLQVLDNLGIDLAALAADPRVRVDYATFGVSYTSYLASSTDFAKLRSMVDIPLLFELTNQIEQVNAHPSASRADAGPDRGALGGAMAGADDPAVAEVPATHQLLSVEMMTTIALDAYTCCNADGIAAFNFEYYRSLGIEPPYSTLARLVNETWVRRACQYWFWIARRGAVRVGGGALPLTLSRVRAGTLRVQITAPAVGTPYAHIGRLRLRRDQQLRWPAALGAVGVRVNGLPLAPTSNTTRLYTSNIPDVETGQYAAFDLPSAAVHNGTNEIDISCTAAACDSLRVIQVEAMLPVLH